MPPGNDKNNGLFWKRQELIAKAPLSIREKWALQVLFIRAGWKDGGECFASNDELQQLFGVGVSQTKKLIQSLSEAGVITNRRTQYGPNIRTIVWDTLEQLVQPENRPLVQPENEPNGESVQPENRPRTAGKPALVQPKNEPSLYRTSLEHPINNPKGKSGSRSKRFKAEEIELPDSLNTPEFKAAWGEWCAFRRSKRKPISQKAATTQIHQLKDAGPSAAIAAIQTSIASDWQGLFPKDQHGGKINDRRTDSGQVYDPSQPLTQITPADI